MRQAPRDLRDTLHRIHALITETGSTPSDVLDAEALSRATAVPVADVQALLDGHEIPDDDIEARVRQRVRTLFEMRVADTGRGPTAIRREVGEQLQRSHEWVRRLCNGSRTPNVSDLARLHDYFGLPEQFQFTAPAAEVVNTALRPVLTMLEVTAGNLLARYREDFDQVVTAARGYPLTSSEAKVITAYVTAILEGSKSRT